MTSHNREIPSNETTLDSWKEIAAYLQRDVSTAIRWEKSEELPVHRHQHSSRASVYAFTSELDAWKAARKPQPGESRTWRRWVPALAGGLALLAVAAFVQWGPIMNPPAPLAEAANVGNGVSLQQVWAGPDVDFLGAPSPDGRFISFVDWSTGDLAIRDLETGENRRLTKKGTWFDNDEFALFSTVSPDGSQVAYTWFNKDFFYDLRLVGLDGSEPRVLYSNEEVVYLQPTDWSADGKHVLATLSRKDRTNQIVLISAADGSVQVIKTLDWRYPEKMGLSPDGKYIVYDFPTKPESPERDIFLLAADGSRETPLVEHPANDLFPVWAPDGSRVVFASNRTGSMGAWSIAIADGKAQGSPELIKPDVGRILPMGFSADGTLFYGLNTSLKDVYTSFLEFETGDVAGRLQRATHRFVGSNTNPDWSPDGKHFAYLSQRGPTPFGLSSQVLCIRSLATGDERELAVNLSLAHPKNARLRWSPDGRTLLVVGKDTNGRRGIYRVDAKTGEVEVVVQGEPGEYVRLHDWSPDGRAVFYSRQGPGATSRIVKRDLGTGRDDELVRQKQGAYAMAIAASPKGDRLAFAVFDRETRSGIIKLLAASSGTLVELARVEEPKNMVWGMLEWTPDGKYLIFANSLASGSSEWQKREVWRVPATGGEPQRLELSMDGLAHLRIHPDGKRVAFTGGQDKSEVWVMENFLPELRAKQ